MSAIFDEHGDLRKQIATRQEDVDRYTGLISRLEAGAAELRKQIADEETRTGVVDQQSTRYSTIAAAAQARLGNSLRSIEVLNVDLGIVQEELALAKDRLAAAERISARREARAPKKSA